MSLRNWHLITYDVRDAKRLRKVAKKLEGYGTRIQFSVFRVRVDNQTLEKLHWELNHIMENEDDLLVIPLCNGCACKVAEHSTGDQSDWAGNPPSYRVI